MNFFPFKAKPVTFDRSIAWSIFCQFTLQKRTQRWCTTLAVPVCVTYRLNVWRKQQDWSLWVERMYFILNLFRALASGWILSVSICRISKVCLQKKTQIVNSSQFSTWCCLQHTLYQQRNTVIFKLWAWSRQNKSKYLREFFVQFVSGRAVSVRDLLLIRWYGITASQVTMGKTRIAVEMPILSFKAYLDVLILKRFCVSQTHEEVILAKVIFSIFGISHWRSSTTICNTR